MFEKNIGVSQQTLVSTTTQDATTKAKKLPQYLACLSATLGALASGMVLGWTSTSGKDGINLIKEYKIDITPGEFSWIGSLMPLGAAAMCIPIGILSDFIGRKYSMLLMVVPFSIGWLLLIFANSVVMFYIGRFVTGLCVAAFCVVAPMYSAEIAESEIRGTVGSFFQLLLTAGILISYVLGKYISILHLSIVSAVIPLIFFAIFFFMPESPMFYLKKGRMEDARSSLIRVRGPLYNVEHELDAQREVVEESARNRVSILEAIRSRAVVKGLIIAFGLMLYQQLSGVNAVIFYASDIFTTAGSSMDPQDSTIVVGVMQVVAVFVSTLIVDKLGRRLLLLSSESVMFLTTFVLGVFFYLDNNNHNVESIRWLPLVSVCVFIILFSLGFGPIPWMMMGEIFAPEVKGIAASSACFFNWIMAFLVTKFYSSLNDSITTAGTFWLFSLICGIGVFFVYFLVPETKGKSLNEIQRELNT